VTLQPGAVLAGIGIGLEAVSAEVFRVAPRAQQPQRTRAGTISQEKDLLVAAVAKVSQELEAMSASAEPTNSEILQALSFMISDPELLAAATSHIEKGWTAGSALFLAVEEFAQLLAGDPHLEERAADLKDLASRVSAELNGNGLGSSPGGARSRSQRSR